MHRFVTLLFALTLIGCESKAGTGALVGAGGGAVIGGALGGGGGALIGGAAGAVGGAVIGAALDSSDRNALEKESPRTLRKIDRGEPLTITDIKKMSRAGINDEVIMSQIDATHSVFHLSTADIVDLKKIGVSQRVINYMIQTAD